MANDLTHWVAFAVIATAFATIAIAFFTWRLWLATHRMWRNASNAERAYVKMSHHPPGIAGWKTEDGATSVYVNVEVKNWGRTPATVTRVHFKLDVRANNQNLPARPDYATDTPQVDGDAFLVTMDSVTYRQSSRLSAGDASDIKGGEKKLYIYGFVEYVDTTGEAHRAGYGRLYKRWRDDPNQYFGGETGEEFRKRSNLAIMRERGYNYDMPAAASATNLISRSPTER